MPSVLCSRPQADSQAQLQPDSPSPLIPLPRPPQAPCRPRPQLNQASAVHSCSGRFLLRSSKQPLPLHRKASLLPASLLPPRASLPQAFLPHRRRRQPPFSPRLPLRPRWKKFRPSASLRPPRPSPNLPRVDCSAPSLRTNRCFPSQWLRRRNPNLNRPQRPPQPLRLRPPPKWQR